MAKLIAIPKETFDILFDRCRDKLKLDAFQQEGKIPAMNTPVGELHAKFHYEISRLKNELENS